MTETTTPFIANSPMTSRKIGGPVLLGGGALCRDLIDMFGAGAFAGIYVDPGFKAARGLDLPVVHTWADARALSDHVLLAISGIEHRRLLLYQALAMGMKPCEAMVSPHAILARDAKVGPGCVVGHHAVIGPSVRLHSHVLVMHGVIIGHDSEVREQAVICAGASLAGGVDLGADCFIGPNAAIGPQLSLAAGCSMLAGAVCLRSVDRPGVLVGNPARWVRAA